MRDKDGISAAVEFLAVAAELEAQGSTAEDRHNGFAQLFGGHASTQVSLRFDEVANIDILMQGLRDKPLAKIGNASVVRADDFLKDVDEYPPSNILRYYLNDDSRVVVRPSGTEPELKVYIDTQISVGRSEQRLEAAGKSADRLAEAVGMMLGRRS